MQMNDTAAASPFMQVVHVLCDDGQVMLLLQSCKHLLRMVGLHLQEIFPTGIVEVENGLRVFLKTYHTCQFPGIKFLSHPVVVTECRYSTFLADSRSSEHHDILSYCHYLSLIVVTKDKSRTWSH